MSKASQRDLLSRAVEQMTTLNVVWWMDVCVPSHTLKGLLSKGYEIF